MFFTDNNNNNSKIGKVTYTATTAQYTRSIQDVNTLADQSVYTTIEIPNTNPPKYSRVLVRPQRNPIKHYRRQYSSKIERHPSQLKTLDMPGKSIVSLDECPLCDQSNVAFTIIEVEYDNERSCNALTRLKGSSTLSHNNDKYNRDFRGYLEQTCRTYNNNPRHKPQNLIKNGGECNIDIDNQQSTEFWSNKRTISNGTTSIASYRRQYRKNYKEIATIPDPRQCCIRDSNPTHNNCHPHAYPNLTHRKLICSNIFKKG